ncbi:MAG: hypothetical protein SGJ04_04770 [Bacteroidota bacterium]|nr:hypothetical protein [Bacteroidota bacterium]
MNKILSFFILVLLLSVNKLTAQKREFTDDAKLFPKELREFFKIDTRKETQDLLDNFLQKWEKNEFTTDEQAQIMDFSNTMLRQRLRVSPEFTTYIKFLLTYKDKKIDAEKFKTYHEIAEQLLNKSKKDFIEFTQTIAYLFEDLVLTKSSTKTWKISTDDYTIEYQKEPVIVIKKTDLICITRGDTLEIFNTSGIYTPGTSKFVGKGGEVYWTRVGFTKEKAYAKLKKLTINLENADFSSDSVEFYYPQVFKKPIYGKLQDKATIQDQKEDASYPRFYSYQSLFELKNIFKNIDYRGGFALEGSQILGTTTDSSRCVLTIKQNNKVIMRALSKSFIIDPDKISSSKSAISVYLGTDSIYHSQVKLDYRETKRTITLSRDNVGLYLSPFFDSYHQLEYLPNNLIWNIDSNNIYLRNMLSPSLKVEFESASFFNMNKYISQQGLVSYNPLKKLSKMIEGTTDRVISEKELEVEFQNKITFLNNMLFMLANEGFIVYDISGHNIIIKDKLLHYVKAAEDKEDFDNIRFESNISALPNGKIDLANYSLHLQGISNITISDTQSTYIVPKNQQVIFKKNRDADFGGQIHSGRFDFYGEKFNLNYKLFKVTLNNVDSVKFKFPEYDSLGKFKRLRTIQTTIQNANGFLYIDDPNNKSGKKNIEKYPVFECNKESFVYYDKPQIFNAVYNRKKFYFKINPFIVNNLDKFTAEGLQFPGTFYSADIIPVITNALTIQEDFSLGFKTNSPEPAGFKLYKGKGIGKGKYLLSNQGFRSDGVVNYLTSKTESKNFIFFPDSMNSPISEQFIIPEEKNGKYPPVLGSGTINHWMPYKDSMYIYKGKDPISVYAGKIDFAGSFILTPLELVGSGQMAYQNLNIKAEKFAFLPKNIKTRDGDVVIKSSSTSRSALEAQSVNLDINLQTDFGKFQTNEDSSRVYLPSNKFSTTLNTFTYDIKSKQVEFSKAPTQSEDDAYFVSENPDQNNLKFQSTKASYNINQSNIKAQGVPFILIADSKIFTPNQEINIEKEGNIGSVKEATIIASAEEEYHTFYKAYVTITGQNSYSAYAFLDYVDVNKKKWPISITDIRINETNNTVAKGMILDSNKFFISPGIKYTGAVNVLSTRKNMEFDGYILCDLQQVPLVTKQVKIKEVIDAENVVMSLDNPLGNDGQALFSGVYISADSNKIYNILFGKKKSANDREVFSTSGVLKFDPVKNEFRYGPKDKAGALKIEDEVREGNLIKVNTNDNSFYAEGLIDLGVKYRHLPYTVAGNYLFDYKTNKNSMNTVLLLDLPVNSDVAKQWIDSMQIEAKELDDADINNESVLTAISMIVKSKKEKEKALADVAAGVIPITGELDKTLIFSDLKLTWVDSLSSFISFDKISLANIKGSQYNKVLNGVISFNKGEKDKDRFSMLLQPNEGSFTFWSYIDGDFSQISSDITLTDKITATAKKTEKSNKGLRLKLATMDDVYLLYMHKR